MTNQPSAEAIVAANIEAWGWGPLSEIEGLAEHCLAIKACQAGLAARTPDPRTAALVAALEKFVGHMQADDFATGDNPDDCYEAAVTALATFHASNPASGQVAGEGD